MATYVNNLRLKEIATGAESGTWGTSTNTNLELIADALGYNTQASFSSDANVTTTVADGTADPARALYFKVTSGVSLTATRELTIAPNTVSRLMWIENATTGSQTITIKQGSGATINIGTGETKIVYLDGAGAGAAVVDALANLNLSLTSQVTGTLPIANGGTNSTSTTYCSLTTNVSGVLPFANGGSGAITPLRKGTSYAAVNRDYIIATAGSITITLPASPTAGDTVTIKDGTGAAATTSFTVARNGSPIASAASDLTFDKNWAEIVMTYIDGSIGWSV